MPFRGFERQLKDLCRTAYYRSIKVAHQSEEPYATHIPVLMGVAAVIKPRLLVEFGCGAFSTLSFLDKSAFPSLERVESYENNKEWFDQIHRQLPVNSQIRLHFVQGDMHRAVGGAGTSNASMIFVDDSQSAEERAASLIEIARCCGTAPIVVLHDYDVWRLRLAARRFPNRLSFNAFNPQCGVLWHGHAEHRHALEHVNEIIQRFAGSVPPTDIRGWREIFSNESH